MSYLEAILLGFIQGITEFFPVSSSGHLELAQAFFGLTDFEQYILFDLVCHMGTLVAILIVYGKDILSILKHDRKVIAHIFVALLPLLPLYPFLHSIEALYQKIEYLGYFFLITSALLFISDRQQSHSENPPRLWQSLLVGVFQALALLPGVSRSGATISSAKFLGWKSEEAVRFSFLLAIPTILGGFLVKAKALLYSPDPPIHVDPVNYILGFFTSLVIGWFALRKLIALASKGSLKPFAFYCFLLGIGLAIWTW